MEAQQSILTLLSLIAEYSCCLLCCLLFVWTMLHHPGVQETPNTWVRRRLRLQYTWTKTFQRVRIVVPMQECWGTLSRSASSVPVRYTGKMLIPHSISRSLRMKVKPYLYNIELTGKWLNRGSCVIRRFLRKGYNFDALAGKYIHFIVSKQTEQS